MYFESNAQKWVEQTYGKCDLEDPRRTRRLLDLSLRLAQDPEGSLSRICRGDSAAKEGAYKLIENRAVRPDAIAEGISKATAKLVKKDSLYLAIQDTSDVSFSHGVADQLKEQGSPRGFLVHSTILVDAKTREPIGLIDQERWTRKEKSKRPGRKTRAQRPFEQKESYKWATAYNRTMARISEKSSIITVCDREADIFEFLHMFRVDQHRYVIRSSHDRKLQNNTLKLRDQLRKQPVLDTRIVTVEQRGGQKAENGQQSRPARQGHKAHTEIRTGQVTLAVPQNLADKSIEPVIVNAVLVEEVDAPEDRKPISWLLLTSELVKTKKQAALVLEFYTTRWQIEEFHKSWKTGCNLENRKLQSLENIERMMVICAPIAIRLLQLRSLATIEKHENKKSCTCVLDAQEWQCLYMVTKPGKSIPSKPPDALWAYYALAQLAGWTDSKRTGKVGWQTLWIGWQRLQLQLDGWRAAMAIMEKS